MHSFRQMRIIEENKTKIHSETLIRKDIAEKLKKKVIYFIN